MLLLTNPTAPKFPYNRSLKLLRAAISDSFLVHKSMQIPVSLQSEAPRAEYFSFPCKRFAGPFHSIQHHRPRRLTSFPASAPRDIDDFLRRPLRSTKKKKKKKEEEEKEEVERTMEEADLPFASETGRRVCGGRGKKRSSRRSRAADTCHESTVSPALTIRGRRRKG